MRVFLSILEFFNSCKFIQCLLLCLIFGFFTFSSLISFGQNSLQTGLVAWYPFDGNASDMSGNGNHGTVNGASLSTDRHGVANKAYQFDGVDDFIDFGTGAFPGIGSPNQSVTFSSWFKAPTTGNTQVLFGDYSATSGDNHLVFSVELRNTGSFNPLTRASGFNYEFTSVATGLTDGTWHQVVYQLNASDNKLYLYLDGSFDSTAAYDSSLDFRGSPYWRAGANKWQNQLSSFYGGAIDDIRIYDRALSAVDVLALYSMERVNTAPTDLNSTASLAITENQPIGTVVVDFNATDPDVNATLTYHLVSGAGDGNNSLFTMDLNGTLKTATTFDYEYNASTYSIRVQTRDEFNATVEGNFSVVLSDVLEDFDGDGLADHLEQVGSTQIRIRAQIDGTSRLVFKKGSIQWNHISAAKPGQHNGANYPTTINGDLDWMPQWNNDISDEFNQTNVDLRGTIQIQPVVARSSLLIVQQPTVNNEQTTIVEIFDSGSGPSFYEFILTGQGLSGYLTDPQDPDSDNDGFNDGMEVTSGSNPLISSSTPLNHGLVAWWKLDDGNGVVALDSSVNEYNGSLINGPVWGQGKVGGALQFDGLNDHVLLPNAVLENRNNQGAISLWFNAPSANSTGYLFNAVGTSQPDNRYYIRFNAGLNGTLGNPAYDFPANTIQPNTWHFSTMVWRNSTSDASFYLDGQLSSHSDSNYQLHSHIGKANLGSHMGVNGWFAGLIDEVRIYNRALSTSEVAALYQLENTPPQDLNTTVTGTVQYNGMIPGPAYVWALDANGTKVAEQILADGNGSYSLNVLKGAGYDFKVFIDGTGDGYPQAYEVWKHIGDWNSSLGGFNLTQVDGNLSGLNFNLFDSDYDSDGFTNWQEYQAGTNQNDANSTPGLNFGLVGWWPFDGNVSDMSGNGNHGTVNGANFSHDRKEAFGINGQALAFDTVQNNYAEIPHSSKYNFGTNDFTVNFWVKGNSQSTHAALFIKAVNPNHPYEGITLFLSSDGHGKLPPAPIEMPN